MIARRGRARRDERQEAPLPAAADLEVGTTAQHVELSRAAARSGHGDEQCSRRVNHGTPAVHRVIGRCDDMVNERLGPRARFAGSDLVSMPSSVALRRLTWRWMMEVARVEGNSPAPVVGEVTVSSAMSSNHRQRARGRR